MTNDNFYQKQGSALKALYPSLLQYGGLMAGVGTMIGHALKQNPTNADDVEKFLMGTFGLFVYMFGKGMEYARRSDSLNTSFTHLEETLREEIKKNNPSPK